MRQGLGTGTRGTRVRRPPAFTPCGCRSQETFTAEGFSAFAVPRHKLFELRALALHSRHVGRGLANGTWTAKLARCGTGSRYRRLCFRPVTEGSMHVIVRPKTCDDRLCLAVITNDEVRVVVLVAVFSHRRTSMGSLHRSQNPEEPPMECFHRFLVAPPLQASRQQHLPANSKGMGYAHWDKLRLERDLCRSGEIRILKS